MLSIIKTTWDVFTGKLTEDPGYIHPRIKEHQDNDLHALELVRQLKEYVKGQGSCKDCVIQQWCHDSMIHCPEQWKEPPTVEELQKINEAAEKNLKDMGWLFIDEVGLPLANGPYLTLYANGKVKSSLFCSTFNSNGYFVHKTKDDSIPIVAYKMDDGLRAENEELKEKEDQDGQRT